MSKRNVIITILSVLFIVYSISVITFLRQFKSPQEFLLYMFSRFPESTYEVSLATRKYQPSRGPVNTIRLDQVLSLRKMLTSSEFDELNKQLDDYQKSFEANYMNEYMVFDAFQSFGILLPAFESYLQDWIDYSPEDYQPYLARAFYYYEKGWQSRGFKWARATTEEQFAGMELYFSKAKADINKSLEINSRLMPAYYLLISIYSATGEDDEENKTIKKGIELFPYSYLVRKMAIHVKLPRWGGSYYEMELLAKDAEKYAVQNPELYSLYGFIYTDQADILERKNKLEKVADLYRKALNYGDNWEFYYDRASFYEFNMNDSIKALSDVNRAIFIRPTQDDAYLLRSKIFFYLGDYKKSLEDLYNAQSLNPGEEFIQRWRESSSIRLMNQGHEIFNKNNYADAIDKYSFALQFNGTNPEAFYWRGISYYRLKQYEHAMDDFINAISANPHYFEAYRMIDYLKSMQGDWASIISYWDRFLSLEPNHAGALLERAGTYYHMRNFDNCLRDLKKSCDLGNNEACAKYRQMKNILR